jgi:hypothetical protein
MSKQKGLTEDITMSELEKKVVAQIRTRLASRGYTGWSNQEIFEKIKENYRGGFDVITNDIKTLIVDKMITERGIITTTDDSGENEGTVPESSEITQSELDMIGMLSTVDPVAMVKQQAKEMEINISDKEVQSIAENVQETEAYNSNEVEAIRNALIQFIDWQHQQSSSNLTQAIAEVSQHATTRQIEFNNQMVGEVNKFFRVTRQNSQSNFTSIISALQIPGQSI